MSFLFSTVSANASTTLETNKEKENDKNDNHKPMKKLKRTPSLQMMVEENDRDQILVKENVIKEKVFSESYFKDYYIDFNKDFPIYPEGVLKSKSNK